MHRSFSPPPDSTPDPFRSDRRHRSADQADWQPRCPGCLPQEVRPHRCQGNVVAFGFSACRCPEERCRTAQVDVLAQRRLSIQELREIIETTQGHPHDDWRMGGVVP